jgi:integrase
MMSIAAALDAVAGRDKLWYVTVRQKFIESCPTVLKALHFIDESNKKPKRGYSLVKRENKKLGFVYYVRYLYNHKMLPSKWNTHTNLLDEAERFARANRDKLIEEYLRRKTQDGLALFRKFYEPGSPYLVNGRSLVEQNRRIYENIIKKQFLPYLQKRGIGTYEKIKTSVLSDFQEDCLLSGAKPQSINVKMNAVKRIFRYLKGKGKIKNNPCANLERLYVDNKQDVNDRGCHEVEALKGVFEKPWEHEQYRLLCLVEYTTGMRNSEIVRIRLSGLIEIGGCHFIDIKESKTENGIRLVPLHEKVHAQLVRHASTRPAGAGLFPRRSNFTAANLELGKLLGMSKETLEAQNITFISGRHFWKTMLNGEDLGDIEEVFMGHRVTGDIAARYNHRDKQGKERLIKKARQVAAILDTYIFR